MLKKVKIFEFFGWNFEFQTYRSGKSENWQNSEQTIHRFWKIWNFKLLRSSYKDLKIIFSSLFLLFRDKKFQKFGIFSEFFTQKVNFWHISSYSTRNYYYSISIDWSFEKSGNFEVFAEKWRLWAFFCFFFCKMPDFLL